MRLIDADSLIGELHNTYLYDSEARSAIYEKIGEQPTIDAVPVAWINKHLEWLDNCDNDFAQLAKVSIFGMLELWRKDSVYGKRVTK